MRDYRPKIKKVQKLKKRKEQIQRMMAAGYSHREAEELVDL